jgi:superfamily II DNA/RNA helicase
MSQSFADLGISHPVADALAARGFTTPFAVQAMVVPDVLAGHDVLAKSPTGSGKTLAFAAPIVDRIDPGARRPAALVLAPTRELAAQIVEESSAVAQARGLTITAVYGGVGIERQAKLARRSHILVATPGRLLDLIGRGAVSLRDVRILVLDEADRMLDMGFRPDVDRIVSGTPRERQTLFFSATLDGEVGRLAAAYTRSPRRHEHAPPALPVEHRFVRVSHEAKVDTLVSHLAADERGLALVFVRTKRGADRLSKRLAGHGVPAGAIHGNKSQTQREKTLERFAKGHVDTLVATDVAARGIDVNGITHVINFDPPGDHTDYTHRIGRTARAGRSGIAITFVLGDQAHGVEQIARQLDLHREFGHTGFQSSATAGARPAGSGRKAPPRGAPRNGRSYGGSPRRGSGRGGRRRPTA